MYSAECPTCPTVFMLFTHLRKFQMTYIFVLTEHDTHQAMLRSMAIIRGETDKIELSLNKYKGGSNINSNNGNGNGNDNGKAGLAAVAETPSAGECLLSMCYLFVCECFLFLFVCRVVLHSY